MRTARVVGVAGVCLAVVEEGVVAQDALDDAGALDDRLELEGARCAADELCLHVGGDVTQVGDARRLVDTWLQRHLVTW